MLSLQCNRTFDRRMKHYNHVGSLDLINESPENSMEQNEELNKGPLVRVPWQPSRYDLYDTDFSFVNLCVYIYMYAYF